MTSSANAEGLAPGLKWQVESLRLTGIMPSAEAEAAALWQQVVGEEPSTTTRQKGILQQAEGPCRDRLLSLVVRPERTDWMLSASESIAQEIPPGFATIGTVDECLEIMRWIVGQWTGLDTCPSYQRIAFGAVLRAPIEDRQAGYRAIQGLLPAVTLDPSGSSDFSYQINRPRITSVADLNIRVNRLMKWSVAKLVRMMVELNAPRPLGLPESVVHACRLELDISTDADFVSELKREQMRVLFELFVQYAVEISREGDRQ